MLSNTGRELGEALRRELKLVRDVGNTQPTKYDRVKNLFVNRLRINISVCYISDLSKQWTPRVGQAIMGLPRGLVILASESFAKRGKAGEYTERLVRLAEYVGGLEFALVFVGEEKNWVAELFVAPVNSEMVAILAAAFPEAKQVEAGLLRQQQLHVGRAS
jgi:hypothetical protein